MKTVTYFEFVSHVLPVVYEHFRRSGAGTGEGLGAGTGGEVEMVDRAGRAVDDMMGENGTASLSSTLASSSVAAVGFSTDADMPLKTSRAATAAEAGVGTGMGAVKGTDSGSRTEKQSEILQVLEGDLDTVQGRGTSKGISVSMSMSMTAEGVTGTDSADNKEKATTSNRRDSAFNIIPEYGIYDVTVEGDEEATDTYRNMLAVVPPPTV